MAIAVVKAVNQLSADNSVPNEFVLLRSGWNDYADGQLLFDAEAAGLVMARYAKRGLELTADYEHQSLSYPPVEAPASASKWTPELRNGDLIAASIKWTPRAARMIADGEYRYFSIAARIDTETKRIVEVINFGLTNLPAANGIEPLKAASITGAIPRQEKNEMKTVLVALGLSAELEESAAVVEASRLAELKRDVLAITKKSSVAEAIGALRAWEHSHEQVVALSAQVAKAEAEKRGLEFDALVAKGSADRKLTPAQLKGKWLADMRAREGGVIELKSYLEETPAFVEAKTEEPKETAASAESVSAEEWAVARAFVGDDTVAIKKRIAEIRELNASLKGKA